VSLFFWANEIATYGKQGKAILVQAWTDPEGYGRLRLPDNRHMKVVRLSALCTGHLYPPANFPGTHFWQRLSEPQGYSVARRVMTFQLVAQ